MRETMTARDRVPVAGPWITEREIRYVTDAVTNGWYDRCNLYINKFEEAFSGYVGRKHAIALPSCTSAIHLSLLALGVGPGDEVIVPDVTWIATSAPIRYVGAREVFADVDARSWCLCPRSFENS
ncbi:MAG: aminotransferase class I/II-fold pyridoxal phosphate-dependent enzyme, partial [Isosphaeraceae bacterium]